MSIIILLLNLFFLLLIFYQLFLGHNIFKRKIIEGAVSNSSPSLSNIPLNATTNAEAIPIPVIPSSPIPADDNTIYNIIVQLINYNNTLISSVTNVILPTFVSVSVPITSLPIPIDINKPYNESQFIFTEVQLFILSFTVYAINNNNKEINRAINKPNVIVPNTIKNNIFTNSIPASVSNFFTAYKRFSNSNNLSVWRLLQTNMIRLINENNAIISIPLNIAIKPFNPK